MANLISFIILISLKYFAKLFYRFKITWPKERINWDEIRLIIFLNHTSLYEFLYLGFLPNAFLCKLSKRMVAPAASKTMDRPLVGLFFKLFNPGMISITRKRDASWKNFKDNIKSDSIIIIAPEGRMKRTTGLDLEGNKMSVKSGVLDVLAGINNGDMVIAYSGGIHHVQVPGEGLPKLFKRLKMNLEYFNIKEYKNRFSSEIGSEQWRKSVLADLQWRLENNVPVFS
jgi:1-acyl-sn-glycerol-3-phosphate acyltransferase